ncbi:M23 family metallopeptidase [Solitalea canadensis]|uniref:Metalloendopeptidase-like membrane protein n=1 Tax=Solitalea canadensis (strain ATCC 29591 / DSM 3403 / JCM 21819 / LMG 8368 / NBRC 15130 / NCIMB 12057 / USAM 9D) TaxID=929556 RepID=H8KQZ5_SOLCM|nr:M23 family metallopeptidase [Solitalea canadensis]AFD07141.1 metalloendopeptidase-like membrane protein [Solitalea canadensis DSM 3403]
MAKKVKYFYNSHTLKYEKVELSVKKKVLRVLGYLATVTVFSVVAVTIAYNVIDSPKEKKLKRDISQLNMQYDILKKRIKQMDMVVSDLQERDNNIYRTVFESEPITSDEWQTTFAGINRYKALESANFGALMIETTRKLDELAKKMYIQSKSYDYLAKEVKNKDKLLASVPAIQPVSNKDLTRMASGYGYRIHPIYKTRKFHAGMDFTSPTGTPIYATGDGVVITAGQERGYGNEVKINHGYGYQTLYGHMSKIAVRVGNRVKRGEVIGYVGSTGASTGPHCHYEVHKNGQPVNPINFYFNDLSPAEYEKMLELSSRNNQSFD